MKRTYFAGQEVQSLVGNITWVYQSLTLKSTTGEGEALEKAEVAFHCITSQAEDLVLSPIYGLPGFVFCNLSWGFL